MNSANRHKRHKTDIHALPALTALATAAVLCLQPAHAQQSDTSASSTELNSVEVKGRRLKAAEADKRALEAVSGGTGQVKAEDIEKRRVSTNEDVLKLQPGVFAQSSGGSDGLKISIRGSAVNRGANFFRSGILFLFDDLPVTGPGGTPYELFEPLGIDHVDILRGPNAFDLGSATLGGAINYHTKTGREAAPFEVRVEAGSFGYRKGQVSSGQVLGDWDYYVSLTKSHRDGYQDLTKADTTGIAGNLGWRINKDIETRFYLRYRKTENQVPGNLTLAQILDDPTQANPVNIGYKNAGYASTRIQPGSTWLANKTTFRIDDSSKLEAGLVWHDYPISIQSTEFKADWGYTDISATLNYTRDDTIFGRASKTTIGLLNTQHTDDGWQKQYQRVPQTSGARAGVAVGTLIRETHYNGADRVIHASNDLQATDNLWVTTGVSAINVERSAEVVYPATNNPYSRNDWTFAPRLGLRYNLQPDIQVFGNVSRSVEPPNDWSIVTTPPSFSASDPDITRRRAAGQATGALDIKDQTATTFEIGTRGTAGSHTWTLSAYYAKVWNELVSVELTPGVRSESNATPTIHAGIEAGLESKLWEFSPKHAITLTQTYTLNDFRFRGDPVFGSNQLPGLPRHVYQASLGYEHPSGFYSNLNLRYSSKAASDYANTYYAPSYALWGATFGINLPEQGWSAYLDFVNIGDKKYVAVINPLWNATIAPASNKERFNPGDGFGVYAGVTYRFK
jgi:iron complex outermembrane receptor protein